MYNVCNIPLLARGEALSAAATSSALWLLPVLLALLILLLLLLLLLLFMLLLLLLLLLLVLLLSEPSAELRFCLFLAMFSVIAFLDLEEEEVSTTRTVASEELLEVAGGWGSGAEKDGLPPLSRSTSLRMASTQLCRSSSVAAEAIRSHLVGKLTRKMKCWLAMDDMVSTMTCGVSSTRFFICALVWST
jgi:hypothetical protein